MMMIHLHHYNHYLIIVGMLGEGNTENGVQVHGIVVDCQERGGVVEI